MIFGPDLVILGPHENFNYLSLSGMYNTVHIGPYFTHTHMHTRKHACKHARTHASTHASMHTQMHARTHTYTYIQANLDMTD